MAAAVFGPKAGQSNKKNKDKRRAERRSEKKRRAQTIREDKLILDKNEREKILYMYTYVSGKGVASGGAMRQHKNR